MTEMSAKFKDSEAKWDFYNDLMLLCGTTEIKGSDLTVVYSLLVAAARELGMVGWPPSALARLVGSEIYSVEILMHMMGQGYCTMWVTLYCVQCDKAIVCVPLDVMREWVIEDKHGRCPYCKGYFEDKRIVYVFDLAQIPWEIDVPFCPKIVYTQGEENGKQLLNGLPQTRGDS